MHSSDCERALCRLNWEMCHERRPVVAANEQHRYVFVGSCGFLWWHNGKVVQSQGRGGRKRRELTQGK